MNYSSVIEFGALADGVSKDLQPSRAPLNKSLRQAAELYSFPLATIYAEPYTLTTMSILNLRQGRFCAAVPTGKTTTPMTSLIRIARSRLKMHLVHI